MIGSMNVVETLEFLWYLQRSTFDGVVYFDTFPIREDPIAEACENVRRFTKMWEVAARLDEDGELAEAMAHHDAIRSQQIVFDSIWSHR
jgi:xylose isomerase